MVILTVIPLLYLASFAVYLAYNSPQRILFDSLEKMEGYKKGSLTKKDKEELTKYLRIRPPNQEEAFLFSDGRIIKSSIASIPNSGKMDMADFSIKNMDKRSQFLYQINSIPLEHLNEELIHIVRIRKIAEGKDGARTRSMPRPRDFIIFFTVIFETAFAVLSLQILSNIAKSVSLVENEAKKLSDGDVENKIMIPMNKGYSNEITGLLEHMENFRLVFKQRKKQRDSFVMGLSHDLKTPLALIKGYTEGIADGLFDEPQKMSQSLDIILQKTSQLEGMIDDLVNFVKMNETDWTKRLVKKDLRKILEEFEKYVKSTAEIFSREANTKIDMPYGIMVRIDEAMLARALGNIFSNAVRYSNSGDKITLEASAAKDMAYISISDEGIGMSKEEAERAFELFYRGTNSRREQGQGIGLSVVKTVMDIHGWNIKVQSEPKKGSSFTIEIPLKEENEEDA